MNKKKSVVIVGAGFAGLNAAKKLSHDENIEVILIDHKNHHLFQPLLYQVATAGLDPSDIAVPIRGEFSEDSNVVVHLAKVQAIDLEKQSLSLSNSNLDISYDYLILACGAQHSYFGNHEWEQWAPGLKTLEQATEIRHRILSAFEKAESEMDPELQKRFLNFVVVGGGPTGVELAGAIAEISRKVLVNDFKVINPASAQVFLFEAGPRVLADFDPSLSVKAKKDLEILGVTVLVNQKVENITQQGVFFSQQWISSESIFWAAGVQARKIPTTPSLQQDRAGRVIVETDLTIKGFKNAFVVGDMAHVETADSKMVPGVAPAAIQMGLHVAKSIRENTRQKFTYYDKGLMATIGKNKAVMQSPGKLIKVDGRVAWWAWLLIHVLYLVGFRNRLSVLSQWVWSYLFSKHGSRLITQSTWKNETIVSAVD
jgi:NADH dehydrogenase